MTKASAGRIGISVDVSDADTYLDDAVKIENLGYSTIWLPGGQLDRLERLSDLLAATRTIQIAAGIIPVDVYDPTRVTEFYAKADRRAPGRLLVGLGGPQQPKPLAGLTDYLDRLEAEANPIPRDRRILAALGPRKLELARDRSAGAITLLVTPDSTSKSRVILGERPTLIVDQLVVLDRDPPRARETARRPLTFLSTVAGYPASFARMGFSDTEIADLSDRLVDELVAWGDPRTIAARVCEQLEAGADQVVLGVLTGAGQPGPLDVARELAEWLPLQPAG